MEPLASRVLDLLGRGLKIEAIKAWRESTGCGLREAKEQVERIEAGLPPAQCRALPPAHPPELPAEVHRLVAEGKQIEAIRLVRECTGIGLKEAKEQVDEIARIQGVSAPKSGCLGVLVLFLVAAASLALGSR